MSVKRKYTRKYTRRRKTKVQKTRRQRGGAVPFLKKEAMGIYNPIDMLSKISFYSIEAHGETTADQKFIVVPPNTFLFFTTSSGMYANAQSEFTEKYTKTNPEKLFDMIFKPQSQTKNLFI